MQPAVVTERPKVVVVSVQGRKTMAPPDADRLEDVADVTYLSRATPLTRREAMTAFAGAEVVAFTPKVAPPVDEVLLAGLPQLRGVALYATGYDFVDVELLTRHGVMLTHLAGYSTTSVAEHALGMLLTLSRRIHLGNDRSRGYVHAGTSLRGFELSGRTLGVVGLGRIGSRVAMLAQALGMRVVAADPRNGAVTLPGVVPVWFDDLLEQADAVCVLCSARYAGQAIIGESELAAMRPGAVLVNASRAWLVDTEAVVAAVRARRLRGYAVDDMVFDPRSHADLLVEGRVVQTGHSAWWSDEVLERGGSMWADSIRNLALGCPVGVVQTPSERQRVEAVVAGEASA